MATQHVDVQVTPVITAGTYAAGNQLGTLLTLPGVSVSGAEGSFLQKVVVIDKSGQSSALDVLLFNQLPTIVSTDKTNVNISAAQMVASCIGNIKITAATYSALTGGTASVAAWTAPNMPYPVKPSNLLAPKVNTIYALLVCRGTPTYTSTSDIVVNFHFSWDT